MRIRDKAQQILANLSKRLGENQFEAQGFQ